MRVCCFRQRTTTTTTTTMLTMLMMVVITVLSSSLLSLTTTMAFQSMIPSRCTSTSSSSNTLLLLTTYNNNEHDSTSSIVQQQGQQQEVKEEQSKKRRTFFKDISTFVIGTGMISQQNIQKANGIVYLDPAMYGDQELRVSAVDSLREAVRRSILQKPQLASSFYSLSIMDALSFDVKTRQGGPDGRIVKELVTSKNTGDTQYLSNLKEAATVLLDAGKSLKKMTAITVADSVALGGAAAVESIGGPVLSTQLGRTDFGKTTGLSIPTYYPPLDLLSGQHTKEDVTAAFRKSGLTDREMTAILGALLTINVVNQDKAPSDWRKSNKGRFVERGKMGRMSDYKRLTEEDIAELEAREEDEEFLDGDTDDGWYIADTFGTRDDVFGQKVGGNELTSKNFNKYLGELNEYSAISVSKRTGKTSALGDVSNQPYGWIGDVLLDPQNPGTQSWLSKYATQPLTYNKDLGIAYNSMTQLGGEFTGGKYESLLKDKPRKTLNDF